VTKQSIHEVVAVFDDVEALEGAMRDLEKQGFARTDFTLLVNEHVAEKKFGQRYRRVEEMEDKPNAPRETFFAWAARQHEELGLVPALMFVGAVSALAVGAVATLPFLIAAGSGGLVGAALQRWIRSHHAAQLRDQLERGGLLLWVNVRYPEAEHRAATVLKAHGAHHVHAHELAPGLPAGAGVSGTKGVLDR